MKATYTILLLLITWTAFAQKPAPKPLYRDPVYDGAADPVVIWNPKVKRWWMFYTNRRATMERAVLDGGRCVERHGDLQLY
jgi:hypothetical protein